MGSEASSVSGSITSVQQYSQGKISHSIVERSSIEYEMLEEIYFCEENAESAYGAFKHAFLIVRTSFRNVYKCEIGGSRNNVQLIIVPIEKDINYTFQAKQVKRSYTMEDLIQFSKQTWIGKTYDILLNNCYDYCKSIMRQFTDSLWNTELVVNQQQLSLEQGKRHLQGIVRGAQKGFVSGFVTGGGIGAVGGALIGGVTGFFSAKKEINEY